MRTVRSLREELAKFPDDAVCYAYEGEVCGIIISLPGRTQFGGPGCIYCGEGVPVDQEKETELL